MPRRASYFLTLISLLLSSGCSVWPGAEHRAVTNDSIRTTVEEVVAARPPVENPACKGYEDVLELLERQRRQMVRLNKQMQSLSTTSPAFAASQCPEREAPASALDGKTIIGASEWIYLTPPGHHYQARVDSGAATSSLSAVNITRFERNGEKWVRFWLQHDDEAEPVEIEAPLVRHVRIRQASADEADRRPVVSLTVNLGNALQQNTEFSLTDRSQMNYPILLGREFLRDVTLIDVGRRFIHPKFEPDSVPAAKPAAADKAADAVPPPSQKPAAETDKKVQKIPAEPAAQAAPSQLPAAAVPATE